MDGALEAYRGATHAAHGVTREGQPWIVSRRSLRNCIHGVPRRGNFLRALSAPFNVRELASIRQSVEPPQFRQHFGL